MSASYPYQVGAAVKTVRLEPKGDELLVTIGDATYHVTARYDNSGKLDLRIDGQRFSAFTAHDQNRHYVWLAGKSWQLQPPTAGQRAASTPAEHTGSLITTMPGLVTEILVAEGDQVERGDTLVILESMKMEQRITAPYDGQVSKIACAVGQVAQPGELLVQINAL